MAHSFEKMLTGGHPNSLGKTIDVVEQTLAEPERFEELFDCYTSNDEVVRLRTSNAMKRIEAEQPDLLVPFLDRFIYEIGSLDQASAQWTLAQLFARLEARMNSSQQEAAKTIMKRNLESYQDWIVLKATMETLTAWAKEDAGLRRWLVPHLRRLSNDPRKSVSSRANKSTAALGEV